MPRNTYPLQNSDLDSALEHQELDRDTPTSLSPEAWDGYVLGNLYLRTGEYVSAIRAYKRLIRLEPNFAHAYYNLGFAHYKEGEFEEAQEALSRAIPLDPTHPEFHFTLGMLLDDMRDYESALASFTQALTLQPTWVQAYRYRGMIRIRLGQLEEARRDYERALEIEPDEIDTMHRVGTIYLQLRDMDKAAEVFHRCLAVHPEDAEAHYYLGEIHSIRKQWENAAEHFEKAISLDTTHLDAQFRLAQLYAKQRYMPHQQQELFRERAVEHLTQLIRLNQELGIFEPIDEAYFLLGSLYDDDPGDAGKAMEAYRMCLKYSDSAAAHNNLGVLYWQNERIADAVREFQAAVQSDPEYDSAYHNLAKLYFYQQDDQMMHDFETWTHRDQADAAKVLYKLSLALMDIARSEAYQGLYSRLHQIKNLLGVAGSKLRSVQRTLDDRERLERQLEEAFAEQQNCYEDMVQLLQSLQQEELNFEFVDLNRLLNSLVDYMSAAIKMQEVHCHLSLPEDLPHVKVDPRQMKEAFHNLVLNALEAMSPGGDLWIGTEYIPSRAEVEVQFRDSGSGIPTTMRQQVFKPGYSSKAQGSGFGLSIVERIVRAHCGRITLDSEEGAGTTLTVYLPVDLEAAPVHTALQMRPILYEAPHDLIAEEDFT